MWFNILKDSKQVSRTMGSIDWENETIPETEDDDCKKWLQEYYDILNNYRDLGGVFSIKIDKIPNKLACKIKEWYSSSLGLDESESNVWQKPIDGFEVSPFFFIGDEWYYEFGLTIQNTETSEVVFNAVITKYYQFAEPAIILGTGTPDNKSEYISDWVLGKNTWTKRFITCLKKLIEHIKPKYDPKEYILHSLAIQWLTWWSGNMPISPDTRKEEFMKILDNRYWK